MTIKGGGQYGVWVGGGWLWGRGEGGGGGWNLFWLTMSNGYDR